MENSFSIHPLVGMSPEVVSLGLCQVGWQPGAAKGIKIGQGGAHSGCRDTQPDRYFDHTTPGFLSADQSIPEEWRQYQVRQFWIFPIGGADIIQESGPDNAAPTPDSGDLTVV